MNTEDIINKVKVSLDEQGCDTNSFEEVVDWVVAICETCSNGHINPLEARQACVWLKEQVGTLETIVVDTSDGEWGLEVTINYKLTGEQERFVEYDGMCPAFGNING